MTAAEERAGRERDAEAAEKVMGWTLYRVSHATYGGTVWDRVWYDASVPPPDERGGWLIFDTSKYPVARAPESWSPSTDIAAAWSVVEAMRAKGYQVEIASRGPRGNLWLVGIWLWDGHSLHGGEQADGLPLAICLAALRALEARR